MEVYENSKYDKSCDETALTKAQSIRYVNKLIKEKQRIYSLIPQMVNDAELEIKEDLLSVGVNHIEPFDSKIDVNESGCDEYFKIFNNSIIKMQNDVEYIDVKKEEYGRLRFDFEEQRRIAGTYYKFFSIVFEKRRNKSEVILLLQSFSDFTPDVEFPVVYIVELMKDALRDQLCNVVIGIEEDGKELYLGEELDFKHSRSYRIYEQNEY